MPADRDEPTSNGCSIAGRGPGIRETVAWLWSRSGFRAHVRASAGRRPPSGRRRDRRRGPARGVGVNGERVTTYPASPLARRIGAVLDVATGLRAWRRWATVPLLALARSYRENWLGPYWRVLPWVALFLGVGLVAGRVMETPTSRYLPHLVLGLVVWRFVRMLARRAVGVFPDARWCVAQTTAPLSGLVHARVLPPFVDFLHHLALACAAGLAFGLTTGPGGLLLALAGVALLWLNAGWIGIAVAIASLGRERPTRRALAVAMRGAVLATPILWMPHFVPNRPVIVDANPLYHLIEVVRGPLLGSPPAALSWWVAAGLAAGGWLLALELLARCRWRVALWV